MKYYPYVSDKPDKKYYIITKDNKKFILVKQMPQITLFIKMRKEKIDIFYAIRKMKINSGINQVLILLHFGVGFIFGRNQLKSKHMNILRHNI